MKKKLKRIGIMAAGIVFLLLGIVGLALPFLQGFLFIAIGLVLISLTSLRLRLWLKKHTSKFPILHRSIERLERIAVRWIDPIE